MIQITLKHKAQILYKGEGLELSPLGFTVAVPMADADLFSDKDGRYIHFDVELNLTPYKSSDFISASCKVASVRRVSQERCNLDIRFADMEQGGYHQIAAFLQADNPAISSEPEQLAG